MNQEFVQIFERIFPRYDGEVTQELTAETVQGWDSLSQITLLMALEKHFAIRFSLKEVRSLSNLGALEKLVMEKRLRRD